MCNMNHIGLRELRQHASDVVKRAESGETITITVSGRNAAIISPVVQGAWRRYEDIADVFSVATDPGWAADLDATDGAPRDPWAQP